ncbi:Terminase [Streptomyces sp. f150]|uniref:Terminase n=1 Tax=Streptomyces sp. f150 TaxID=1827699 RepID=UPI000BF1B458|nr:Terminase [Streptomyces sp. f150]
MWRGPEYEGEFPSLGPAIVDWIETYLCHGPGDVIGEPIEIDDEFYEFIVKLYRIDPGTGKRKVRRAFLSRAKGRAKSELAGMLVCAEALADVRFDGWDANGEPVGRPVRSPYIRCLATEEGQSGNTYDNVSTMLEFLVEHHGDDFPGIDIGKSAQTSSRIVLHQQRGEITPSTASSAAKDGGKESFAVFDETHLYVLPELRRMHSTVRRNLRKRLAAEPWCLETSTMYEPGQDSVAEATHTYYKAIKEGKVRDADAAGLLFDHRQAPDGTDLADRDQLLAGLKAAYGPAAEWMDLDGIISEIWDPQSAASDSRRYWLNQPVAAEDALLDPAEWSLCASPLRLEDGDDVVLGFDGGKTDDATALIAMRVSDRLVHPLGIWERPDGPVGRNWEVDRKQVSDMVAHAFGRWQVRAFFADVKLWESYIDEWADTYRDELVVRASPKAAVGWDMRGRQQELTLATEALVQAIRDGKLPHTDHPTLNRHVGNARRRPNRWGVSFGKESRESPKKVDGFAAMQLADMARRALLASPDWAKRQKKRQRTGRVHGFS